jgi:hypothetical protein
MNNEEKLSEKRYIRQFMMEQKEREMEDTILKVSHSLSPLFTHPLSGSESPDSRLKYNKHNSLTHF